MKIPNVNTKCTWVERWDNAVTTATESAIVVSTSVDVKCHRWGGNNAELS